MDSKLTLKLNAEIIAAAKIYAKETNTSLSRIIENYLAAIVVEQPNSRKVNPIVRSLTGIVNLNDKKDRRKAYAKYLNKKYQ